MTRTGHIITRIALIAVALLSSLLFFANSGKTASAETCGQYNHSYQLIYTTPATCQVGSVAHYKCTKCGDEYTRGTSAPDSDAHKIEKVYIMEANCVQGGLYNLECVYCGYRTTPTPLPEGYEFIRPDGHEWEILNDIDSIPHGETGLFRRRCKYCGTVDEYYVTMYHVMEYQYTITGGNCMTKGKDMYSCSICGAAQERETEYGEHQYEQIYYEPGNCTTKETQYMRCSICGAEKTRIIGPQDPDVHIYVNVYASEPTCEQEGKYYETCKYCGKKSTTDPKIVPAVGHDWKLMHDLPASCEYDGAKELQCRTCGKVDVVNNPALGHDWVVASRNGRSGYICLTCDKFRSKLFAHFVAGEDESLEVSVEADEKNYVNIIPFPSDWELPDGHIFIGWAIDTRTYLVGSQYQLDDEDVYFVANYRISSENQTIYITYLPSIADGIGHSVETYAGVTATLLDIPSDWIVPDGYEFVGWNNGSKTYEVGYTIELSEDTRFEAEFKKISKPGSSDEDKKPDSGKGGADAGSGTNILGALGGAVLAVAVLAIIPKRKKK